MPVYRAEIDNKCARLYMPIAEGGSLAGILHEGQTKIESKMVVFHSIMLTVDFLHDHNIIHGDIKPENVLFLRKNDLSSIVLSDFGTVVVGDNERGPFFQVHTMRRVPPEFRELSKKPSYHDDMKRMDTWACGIILYEMIFGSWVWSGLCSKLRDMERFLNQVESRGKSMLAEKLNNLDNRPLYLLLKGLLQTDPGLRITSKEALAILRYEGLFTAS